VFLGRKEGKRVYESVTAPTKKQAEYMAAELLMKKPRGDSISLREAYRRYCASRSHVLSASTMREYERLTETSLYKIMEEDIGAITTEDVQKVVDDLSKSHSPKTVRNRYGLFTAVMSTYRPDFNFKIALPQRETKDVYIPEPETIQRIAGKIRDHWLFVPFLLASQCGLRASEVSGLQYKHVLLDKILVRQARVASRDGTAIKAPKTKSGTREVRASPELIKVLGKGDPDDFVCDRSPFVISDSWGDWMRAHPEERYFSFHKLRHYFASQALLLGIPKRYVADMMGHASEHMLDQIYEHVFPSARDAFGDRLAASSTAFFCKSQHESQHDF